MLSERTPDGDISVRSCRWIVSNVLHAQPSIDVRHTFLAAPVLDARGRLGPGWTNCSSLRRAYHHSDCQTRWADWFLLVFEDSCLETLATDFRSMQWRSAASSTCSGIFIHFEFVLLWSFRTIDTFTFLSSIFSPKNFPDRSFDSAGCSSAFVVLAGPFDYFAVDLEIQSLRTAIRCLSEPDLFAHQTPTKDLLPDDTRFHSPSHFTASPSHPSQFSRRSMVSSSRCHSRYST